MKILNKTEVLQLLCKTNKKYGMYISFSEEDIRPEVIKAAPYLVYGYDQILVDCEAWLLFDIREEMQLYCSLTVGPDGPTEANDYNGPASVYAMTCNPHGQIETENT